MTGSLARVSGCSWWARRATVATRPSARWRWRWPRAAVLMLTSSADEDKVFESLCNGAIGYLLKSTPPARILEAVREAHAGGAPMSPEIARKVVELFRRNPP